MTYETAAWLVYLVGCLAVLFYVIVDNPNAYHRPGDGPLTNIMLIVMWPLIFVFLFAVWLSTRRKK